MTDPSSSNGPHEHVDTETLTGGTHTVKRIGGRVRRQAGAHTPTIHRLLNHLRQQHGITGIPEPLDHDPDNEIETVSYLPGSTTNYPLRGIYSSTTALDSAAQLLRRIHDATLDFEPTASDSWYLEAVQPVEVICHGDFAPYNCAFAADGTVSGVFDFDTAHPGPRMWDVGYAAYRWVPTTTAPDNLLSAEQQQRRLGRFCRSYGTDDVELVLDGAINRLDSLVAFMRRQALAGNAAFAAHLAAGHDRLYLEDIDYLRIAKLHQ